MKKRLAWALALTFGPVVLLGIFMGLGVISGETDSFALFMIGFLGSVFSLFAGTACAIAAAVLSAVMLSRRENRLLAILLLILSLLIAAAFGYPAYLICAA